MTEDRMMDTSEVADFLKKHPKTVAALIRTKQLKASMIGGTWRIRKSDVDEYLEKQSNSVNKEEQ